MWRDPWIYVVAAVSVAYYAPMFRLINWLGDEGVLIHGAVRILEGKTPYVEFFEVFPPGGLLGVAGWLKLFGATFASVRTLTVTTLVLIAGLTYAAARLASGGRTVAAVLALAWVVRAPHEGNHHWLATAASMASAVALLAAGGGVGSARLASFAAGAFAGAASMILQTRGAYLACAVLVALVAAPSRRAPLGWALGGIALVPGAALLYLVAIGALPAAFEQMVVFPLRHYSAIQYVAVGAFAAWADAGLVAFFPLTFVLAVVAGALGWWRVPRFRASVALALAGLAGAYPRPDTWHLAFVVPLATPLLALSVRVLIDALTGRWRVAIVGGLLATSVCYLGYSAALRVVTATRATVEPIMTARGRVEAYPGPWTRDFAWVVRTIDERTRPEEPLFFYPYMPMLPYLTARHHAALLDLMVPGYTTPAQFREVCAQVMARAAWVVIEHRWSDPARLKISFPALADPNPPEKRAFEAVLEQGFERVAASPNFELLRRTSRATPALCGAIPTASAAPE